MPSENAASSSKRKAPEPSPEAEHDRFCPSDTSSFTSQAEFAYLIKPKKRQKKEGDAAKPKGKGAKSKAAAKGKGKGKTRGKGKAAEDDENEAGAGSGTTEPAQPTNRTLPEAIAFPPKIEGTTRIAAWNICGLAAAQKKTARGSVGTTEFTGVAAQGFKSYVEAEDPDVLVLTETKVNNAPVDPALTDRYAHRYWSIADKKTSSGRSEGGAAGTAILSKVEPLSVDYTLPGHPDPSSVKGRIVTLEFASCYLVGTYVVNAGTGLKTLDAKKEWNTHFEAYIRALDAKKPVIWTGDLNVAPTALDLTNPKPNWNKTPGYTEAETRSFARILNASGAEPDAPKFVDVWRETHPALKHYTYFSYRFSCREKGIGWRLDMFVVSERLVERVKMCEIRSDIYGASDHCPVVMELESPL
ncbi:Endonuclease/exonuclease/phosphatase [Trametes maxima]|nr:Endonuclease/exonuclease/phosphatase [Trametes maxima]